MDSGLAGRPSNPVRSSPAWNTSLGGAAARAEFPRARKRRDACTSPLASRSTKLRNRIPSKAGADRCACRSARSVVQTWRASLSGPAWAILGKSVAPSGSRGSLYITEFLPSVAADTTHLGPPRGLRTPRGSPSSWTHLCSEPHRSGVDPLPFVAAPLHPCPMRPASKQSNGRPGAANDAPPSPEVALRARKAGAGASLETPNRSASRRASPSSPPGARHGQGALPPAPPAKPASRQADHQMSLREPRLPVRPRPGTLAPTVKETEQSADKKREP